MLITLQNLNAELKRLLETAEEQRKNLYAVTDDRHKNFIVGTEELGVVLQRAKNVSSRIELALEAQHKNLLRIAEIVRTPPGASF